MQRLIFFIAICGALLYQSCSEPTTPDKGGAPNPPPWVEISTKIDSLPAEGKTGSIQFQFVVIGDGNSLPVADTTTEDTVNYMRIFLKPDPGRERNTIMNGDSLWEGNISYLDTISLQTQFTPKKTFNGYFTLRDEYQEYDWALSILVGYYHEDEKGNLEGFFGNTDPSEPFNNPVYAYFYVNTNNGNSFLVMKATKN